MSATPGSLRQRLLFGAFYFAEGAPMGWLWWALPSQLRRTEVAVEDITALTAMLAIPWACKFVWAPLVDVLRCRWFGLRGWLVVAQLGMAATLVPMLWLEPVAHWQMVIGLLVAHAFCAATQDVAIDALAIRTVPADQRGALNGAMQCGQIGGRVLFSSGLLFLPAATGERLAVPALLSVLGCTLLLAVFAATPDAKPNAPIRRVPHRRRRYLRALLRTPRFWRLVAFALVGGLGFEAAGALASSWLVDHGFDDTDVATFRLANAAAMVAGALLGGRLADRHGARSVSRATLLALAVLVTATAATKSVVVYGAVYLGIGVFTAASYALFMGSARGPLAATVFSAFMGLTNACEALAGRVGGLLQGTFGYGVALTTLASASLAAWWLLPARARASAAAANR